MKWACLSAMALAQTNVPSNYLKAAEGERLAQPGFKHELYNAQGGALYRSGGGNVNYDDSVSTVFIDSQQRIWVGTVTGLAVFDGKKWTHRTFKMTGLPRELRLLRLAESGPERIVEGPPGTIWLGGSFGLWRFAQDRFEEVKLSSDMGNILDLAVDRSGSLWVVTKASIHRYQDKTWTVVLCPYIGKPASIEARGLKGIAVDSDGVIWIGGTVYGEPTEPWMHDGSIWVVDQAKRERNGGPPMAPLFAFDGKTWKAFGPRDGLKAKWVTPALDTQGRIRIHTPGGYFIREGEPWKPVKKPDSFAGNTWIVRAREGDDPESGLQILFRDGERFSEIRPTDHRTGEPFGKLSILPNPPPVIEDENRKCLWLGTRTGLYRIWRELAPK